MPKEISKGDTVTTDTGDGTVQEIRVIAGFVNVAVKIADGTIIHRKINEVTAPEGEASEG